MPGTAVTLDQHTVIVVSSFAFDIIGLTAGFFCIVAAFYTRFYQQFWLVIAHAGALLTHTFMRVLMLLVFSLMATTDESTRYKVCFALKTFELVFITLANVLNSAMMWWYMNLNRALVGGADIARQDRDMKAYLLIIMFISYSCLAGVLAFINRAYIQPTYCIVDVADVDMRTKLMAQIVLDIPLYMPLILGLIWFTLARTKWKVSPSLAQDGHFRKIHRLFYWLSISYMVAQFPKFVLGFILATLFPLSEFYWLDQVVAISSHLYSFQNVTDGLAIYYILIKPMYHSMRLFYEKHKLPPISESDVYWADVA